MKRTTSTSRTPPSPTTTTYSGISGYQNGTFQPRSPPNQSANYPPLDSAVIAKAHFDELHKYLASYLAKGVCSRLICRPRIVRGVRPRHPGFSRVTIIPMTGVARRYCWNPTLTVTWLDPCPARVSLCSPFRACKLSNIGTTKAHPPHTSTVSRTLYRRVR